MLCRDGLYEGIEMFVPGVIFLQCHENSSAWVCLKYLSNLGVCQRSQRARYSVLCQIFLEELLNIDKNKLKRQTSATYPLSSWYPSTHFQVILIGVESIRTRISWRLSKHGWEILKGQVPFDCFRADSPLSAIVMPPDVISKWSTRMARQTRMPQTPACLLRYADWSIAVPRTQLTASNPSPFAPDEEILSDDVPDGPVGISGLKEPSLTARAALSLMTCAVSPPSSSGSTIESRSRIRGSAIEA